MLNIIIQRLREQFKSVSIYVISLLAYSLLMIGIFPTIQKMDLTAMMKSYPENVAKFFSSSGMLNYNTIEGYLSMEFLSFFFILIVVFYVGSVAGSAIAGRVEKKIMDFDLSQPISRTKYVLAETIVAMKYSAAIVILTSLGMYIFGQAFNAPIHAKGLVAFSVLAVFFLWALYGIAILLSSFLKSKSSVMLITFAFTMGSYIFLSLTRIVDKIAKLNKISIFYVWDPEKLMTTGTINWAYVGVLFLIFLGGLISAIVIFNKKDI